MGNNEKARIADYLVIKIDCSS